MYILSMKNISLKGANISFCWDFKMRKIYLIYSITIISSRRCVSIICAWNGKMGSSYFDKYQTHVAEDGKFLFCVWLINITCSRWLLHACDVWKHWFQMWWSLDGLCQRSMINSLMMSHAWKTHVISDLQQVVKAT